MNKAVVLAVFSALCAASSPARSDVCMKEGQTSFLNAVAVDACLVSADGAGKGPEARARFLVQTIRNVGPSDLELELLEALYKDFTIKIFDGSGNMVSREPPVTVPHARDYPTIKYIYFKLPRGGRLVFRYDLLERMASPLVAGASYTVVVSGQVNFLRPGEERGKAFSLRLSETVARDTSARDIMFADVRLK